MPRRLRALFLNEGALGSGVLGHAQAGAALEQQLRRSPVEARFVVLPPMGRLTRAAVRDVPLLRGADLDLQPVRWHLAQGMRARRAVTAELKREPADVLHLHAHTLSFLAADHMRRVPTLLSIDATVWDWHAMGVWRPRRRHSRATLRPSVALERRALERAAAVLAFSAWTRRAAEAVAPRANVVEHHPGIDLRRFRPLPRAPAERPRVLFVGGRFPQKGGEDLLAVLGPHAGRELELDVVTPAAVPPREGIRVHRLDLGAEELLDLYRRADVFCLPTRGDAVPFAVLEAMACGSAVVATEVGAIPELLDYGRAGHLVPRGDRRALLEAVMGLVADGAARTALGGAARARCEAAYDAERQAAKLLERLHEAAGADRGSLS